MDLKDLVKKMRKALSAEELAKISDDLADVELQAETILSSLRTVREESKGRKTELDSKEAEIAGLQSKVATIEELNTKITELSGYKTKYDEVLEKENTSLKSKWAEIEKKIVLEKTDPKFEKVEKIKNRFKLGENITPDDIRANMATYDLLETTGYFEKEDVNNGKPPRPSVENFADTSWIDASKPTN